MYGAYTWMCTVCTSIFRIYSIQTVAFGGRPYCLRYNSTDKTRVIPIVLIVLIFENIHDIKIWYKQMQTTTKATEKLSTSCQILAYSKFLLTEMRVGLSC